MPAEMYDTVDMRGCLGDELAYYASRTYKPENAIAEFVDNSVASYLLNKPLLKTLNPDYKLTIKIYYDPVDGTLCVTDNAGGMDQQTFKDALVLGKAPSNKNGLNEFGYGLKTAASWFGKKWTVISTTYDNDSQFSAVVDIETLQKTKENNAKIVIKSCEKDSHGTTVFIEKLNRKITSNSINVLNAKLSSIYRRFIQKNEIEIFFNNSKLEYKEPACLVIEKDGVEQTWRKDFVDKVTFEGREYPISGFIGLLKDGNRDITGFALIRRNRLIQGGIDNKYNPKAIFGQGNSWANLRLFGEINMDTFPVTQAKDAFDWDLNGLEDAFLEKMKQISQPFVSMANSYRVKEKKTPISPAKAKEIADETINDLQHLDDNLNISLKSEIPPVKVINNKHGEEISTIAYPISIGGIDYEITVEFENDPELDLVQVTPLSEDRTKIKVTFNSAFPMFSEITNNFVFSKAMQKFFVALVIAEEQTLRVSDDGIHVSPTELRENLSKILIQMSKTENFNDE